MTSLPYIRYIFKRADIESRLPKLLLQYPNFTEGEIVEYSQSDPTSEKSYINWILKLIKNNNIKLPEDHESVFETLKNFDKLKRTSIYRDNKDINFYKTLGDLIETVSRYEGEKG